ncbi:MAG: tyrosine/phenylalanine carboxypeptidase domain-containing protein [Deltaproteobacteria bacterium]
MLDTLFVRAERQSALLQRAWPEHVAAQCASWVRAVCRGEAPTLTFSYRRPPVLTELRAALSWVTCELSAGNVSEALADRGSDRARLLVLAALYAERAAELELDAALAEHIGRPGFAELARRRHAPRGTPDWPMAEQLARDWARAPPAAPSGQAPEALFASDDSGAPQSLLRLISEQIGRLQLAVRVSVVHELASRAATGDGVIYVRAGVRLNAREALRIARHEVLGHALPRARALRLPLGLGRVGCAGSAEEEEGRALLIEQRCGDLGPERRRELGLRHLTALAVADGADAHDCLRLLAGFDCEPAEAVSLYARCARGSSGAAGGLCRELEYLPAWLRVSAAFNADPALEDWLERGRWSLHAARALGAYATLAGTGS